MANGFVYVRLNCGIINIQIARINLFLHHRITCLQTQMGTPMLCHTRKSTVLGTGIQACEKITLQFAMESYPFAGFLQDLKNNENAKIFKHTNMIVQQNKEKMVLCQAVYWVVQDIPIFRREERQLVYYNSLSQNLTSLSFSRYNT